MLFCLFLYLVIFFLYHLINAHLKLICKNTKNLITLLNVIFLDNLTMNVVHVD